MVSSRVIPLVKPRRSGVAMCTRVGRSSQKVAFLTQSLCCRLCLFLFPQELKDLLPMVVALRERNIERGLDVPDLDVNAAFDKIGHGRATSPKGGGKDKAKKSADAGGKSPKGKEQGGGLKDFGVWWRAVLGDSGGSYLPTRTLSRLPSPVLYWVRVSERAVESTTVYVARALSVLVCIVHSLTPAILGGR